MVIKSLVSDVDFLQKSGMEWLSDNLFTDTVEMLTGKKGYDRDRNTSIFNLIKEGAILSDGQLYLQINSIIQ
jgi:hypothetical protein